MIKHNDEYIAVITKYDSFIFTVNEPVFNFLPRADDCCLELTRSKEYRLYRIEKGLNDVEFLHYRRS